MKLKFDLSTASVTMVTFKFTYP